MAAVIDDNATYGVGDMGSGGVEVRVVTRDNGGAKSVTITTGRNEQSIDTLLYNQPTRVPTRLWFNPSHLLLPPHVHAYPKIRSVRPCLSENTAAQYASVMTTSTPR